jgi:hypothetical protein
VGLAPVLLLIGTCVRRHRHAGSRHAQGEATLALQTGLPRAAVPRWRRTARGRLPDVLETLARALPAAALAESVRDVLRGRELPWGPTAVLVIWAVAASIAAARFFRWEEE